MHLTNSRVQHLCRRWPHYKATLTVCVFFACLIGAPGLQAQSNFKVEPPRSWNKIENNETIEASLVAFDQNDGSLTLQLLDKTTIEIKKNELSIRDRKYLKRFQQRQRRLQRQIKPKQLEPESSVDSLQATSQGSDRGSNVRTLYGIDWYSNLDSASKKALGEESNSKDDQPIVWFRVLGDLEDGM